MQAKEFKALVEAEGAWNVKHPILDKVRQCSSKPELAAEFVGMILWPGMKRTTALKAQQLTYLRMRQELKEHDKQNLPKPRKL